jgi:uncharacterized phage-associated protein
VTSTVDIDVVLSSFWRKLVLARRNYPGVPGMADVQDVTAAILADSGGPITTMKLQKLLYYCQGWHLAWEGVPLFTARIEAWANGPVVREVYNRHRGRFTVGPHWKGRADRLTASEAESIEIVVAAYSDWSGRDLAVKTHRERPWLEARGDLPPGARSNAPISPEIMEDYFASFLADD